MSNLAQMQAVCKDQPSIFDTRSPHVIHLANASYEHQSQKHLHELEEKKEYLRLEIEINLYDLADVCGQISALLMSVDWEGCKAIWLDIYALAWVYDAACDNGVRLLREYKKTNAQWSELYQDLATLRLDLSGSSISF
jgi:hypothetical protein